MAPQTSPEWHQNWTKHDEQIGTPRQKLVTLDQKISQRITGETSGDFVDSFQAYKYAEAPHHWFVEGDKEEKPVTNAAYIVGGVPTSDLAFKSNRAVVEEINDERSRIRVIAPAYIEQFAEEFENILNA